MKSVGCQPPNPSGTFFSNGRNAMLRSTYDTFSLSGWVLSMDCWYLMHGGPRSLGRTVLATKVKIISVKLTLHGYISYLSVSARCKQPSGESFRSANPFLMARSWPSGTLDTAVGGGIARDSWACIRSWHTAHALQWCHNERNGVSNHKPHDCLLNRLSRCTSKKTSKLRVTGLCAENSPVIDESPAQRASNAGNISIWWRHHVEQFAHNWYQCIAASAWRHVLRPPPYKSHIISNHLSLTR